MMKNWLLAAVLLSAGAAPRRVPRMSGSGVELGLQVGKLGAAVAGPVRDRRPAP